MCTDGILICVDSAIPNPCLNKLAGYLLKSMLDSETTRGDDDCLLTIYNNDPLKQALIKENKCLASEDGLVLASPWISLTSSSASWRRAVVISPPRTHRVLHGPFRQAR